jgi:hypothetical protein
VLSRNVGPSNSSSYVGPTECNVQSPTWRAMGQDCAWIGVGLSYPALVMASMRLGGQFPSAKFCMGSGTMIPCGAFTERYKLTHLKAKV